VLGRIIHSGMEGDPIELEQAGYALFDMVAERRGNLFSAETVYRLTKSMDATTTYENGDISNNKRPGQSATISTRPRKPILSGLPPNHKFSTNDVIVLTQQPSGSGDFFGVTPISDAAVTAEARVLNTGPTYLDVAMTAGTFEAAFGGDSSSSWNHLRLRVDRFVSNIPYQRMVAALSQLTAVSEKISAKNTNNKADDDDKTKSMVPKIAMDEILKTVILSTHAYTDPSSPLLHDSDVCNLEELVRQLLSRCNNRCMHV